MVVLFHLKFDFFRNGYLGVDIFFVISGYLMALVYDQGSPTGFFRRRFKRLIPAYIALIGLVVLASSIRTVPVDFDQIKSQSLFALFGISNVGFWDANTYFASVGFNPLLNLWSLGVEIQYYLIVPLLLPLLRKSTLLLAIVFLVSIGAAFYVTSISPKTSFFWLPFRVWEFLLGAIAAWYFSGGTAKARGAISSLFLVAALLLPLGFPLREDALDIVRGHPGLAALAVSALTALILSRKLHHSFSDETMLGSVFVTLGKYSYSIYLVHFPVIVLVNYVPFGGTRLGYENFVGLVSIVALTALLSGALYHGVETIKDRDGFGRRFLLVSLFSFAAVIGGVTLNASRFDVGTHKIFAAGTDRDTYRCGKVYRLLNPGGHLCNLSNNSSDNKVLLIGNSHADSIKYVFEEELQKYDIDTYFYVTNEPLMGSLVTPELVLEDVRRRNIRAVVLHYFPGFYADPSYVSNLTALVLGLSNAGVDLYLISPVPAYDHHVPKKLYESKLNGGDTFEGMTLDRYFARNENFFNVIEQPDLQTVEVLLSHTQLCPDDECLVTEKGKPLYFDQAHLTLTGAGLLRPLFNRIAAEIQ